MGEGFYPICVVVEAGDQRELGSSRCEKCCSAADANFLQRFQVVGDEGGACDDEVFDPSAWQLLQQFVGVRR